MFPLIGNTPLMTFPHPHARILLKWEGQNLTGSVKDRAVLAMLRAASLPPGATVIEATSGNTGISLSALCPTMGLRCVITMPENMSLARRARMQACGARILLTPAEAGMHGAVALARQLAGEIPHGFYLNQFENPANPNAHFRTTGPEIWQITGGNVDLFVAGIGTGGTLAGVGRYLREKSAAVKIFGVEPAPDSLLPGLGAGFPLPHLSHFSPDGRIAVTAKEADAAGAKLRQNWGLLAGPSAGAALHAAEILADLPENDGKTIVALLPDTGCRY